MNTEISDKNVVTGCLFCDGDRRFCRDWTGCLGRIWRRHNLCAWLPLLLLPGIAVAARNALPPWIFMWLLAFAIYAGCKWLTYCDALAQGLTLPARTRLLYLLFWPGMSLMEFAGAPAAKELTSPLPRWLAPAARTLAGAGLIRFAVPALPADSGLLRGWTDMVGIIMMLHFGMFDLLALAFQAAGLNARRNMQAPLLTKSLADFWGNRWNTAFNVLAKRYAFQPLAPRIGPHAALAVVFLASGLLHETVITFPAGGGYGLPTAYFAVQAAGLFIERRPWFRRRPWLKRLLAWVVLIAPLGCLFPAAFIRNVILPMLVAIGATGHAP